MRLTHNASFESDYPDERRACVAERSVAVEENEIDDARSGVHVAREGRTVVVTTEADNLVTLRAGVNSWTRLVETAEHIVSARGALSESV